jgi:Asp-tRNA(Asn)/Glu-tRNA(Gln) amidotransferase B subunit
LIENNEVSFSNASAKLLPAIIKNRHEPAKQLALQLQLIQIKNTDELKEWVTAVINKMPEKVF